MQVDWIDHVKERNGKKIGKWRIWTCNHFPLDFRCFVDEIVHHLTKRISTARFCTSGQTFSLLVLRSSSESTKKLWIIKSSMPQNMTLQTRHCWNLQDRAPCRHFNILIVLQIVSCQTINCFIFFFFNHKHNSVSNHQWKGQSVFCSLPRLHEVFSCQQYWFHCLSTNERNETLWTPTRWKTGQTFQKQLLKRSVFRQHRTQIFSTLISNSVTYLQEKHDFNTKPLVPEDQVFTIKVKNTKETIVHQSTANAQHTVIM